MNANADLRICMVRERRAKLSAAKLPGRTLTHEKQVKPILPGGAAARPDPRWPTGLQDSLACWLACLMDGWLGGGLAGLLDGWLACSLVGWLACCMAGLLARWLACWLATRLADETQSHQKKCWRFLNGHKQISWECVCGVRRQQP